MRVVGLDLSLAATGVATAEGARVIRPTTGGMERLAEIRERVLDSVHRLRAIYGHHPDLVVIEGYSYASANSAHQLGELGGVVRLALWETGIRFVDVAPSKLKKYATGTGNAPKAEVLAAAIRRLGYQGHDDNGADAAWLWTMGMDAYGLAPVKMPETHRAALAGVAWPKLAVTP